MAINTPCQTDGAIYGISITQDTVMCMVELPFSLDLNSNEENTLRTNLHNALELVLARYFPRGSE